MPNSHETLNLKVIEPIFLRRSPRLQQLNDCRKAAISRCKNHPIPISSPAKPTNRSTDSSMGITKSETRSRNRSKSDNGSKSLVKSADGSKKTTNFSGKFEGLRRSPRLCNKVNSSVDVNLSFNGKFDRVIHCDDAKSSSNSKKNLTLGGKKDNRATIDIGDSPVTPNEVGRNEFLANLGNNNDSEARVLCNGISINLERRITRSCSRLMERKVTVGKIFEDEQDDSKSLKHCIRRRSHAREILSSVEPSTVKVDGDVRRIRCSKGKENKRDFRSGSKTLLLGKENNVKGYQGNDGKKDDSCRQILGDADKRMNSSNSHKAAGENDVYTRTMERRSSRLSLINEGRMGEVKGKEEKREGEVKAAVHIDVKDKESHDCIERDIDKLINGSGDALSLRHISGRGGTEREDVTGDGKTTGVKRKRKQVGQGTDQGWTKEQEAALHRAYFTAKPSPHFWKKVAKVVPGKSAQECFDKVHSDNQTPIFSKISSRAKKKKSPINFLLSSSELFKSPEAKSKKAHKMKSQMARKTVRHLLQKYCHVNENNEADLFSVLEPSVNPSAEAFQLTPKQLLKSPESSSKSRDRSSSGRKWRSRFSNRSESPLTSPPVLKKVKNMALHEKYIDQLHIRDRKRKVSFSRCVKLGQTQKDGEKIPLQMKDIIKSAKDALVFDAKDAIDKFRHSQANLMAAFSDSEDVSGDDEEDEPVL